MTDRAVLSWSGGKDAAFALARMRDCGDPGDRNAADPEVRVERLLTTTSAETDRVTMHGVRPDLVRRQASAAGLPVDVVELPADPSNEAYERVMAETMRDYADRGIDRVAFADLFLEDVRAYRESNLAGTGLTGYWPVWGLDTADVARTFLDRGFRATVVCVDGSALDRSFAGRAFDRSFLAELPDGVDPCGENGEFHTFVHDGPVFDRPVPVETGRRVTREVQGAEFHYCDLLAAE